MRRKEKNPPCKIPFSFSYLLISQCAIRTESLSHHHATYKNLEIQKKLGYWVLIYSFIKGKKKSIKNIYETVFRYEWSSVQFVCYSMMMICEKPAVSAAESW
jgi:hypothetical protein